jgi:hypothetical protein
MTAGNNLYMYRGYSACIVGVSANRPFSQDSMERWNKPTGREEVAA